MLPGGVNSPVRAFRGVGGVPRFIRSARGCHLFDEDRAKYIDYVGSWGAAISGHNHTAVVVAIERALADGINFGTPCRLEVELAERMVGRVPWLKRVRMTCSGTEAVMSAVRLARAATGRDKIIKFAGCYHGHSDGLLVRAGSGAATLGVPDSAGVTAGAASDTLVAPYNDLDSVASLFAEFGESIAAVLVEPVAGNMGVVPPVEGFLAGLQELTRRHGALLIFDEVMTGFRVSAGGASSLYGVEPDLGTFGKVIGGGLPVGVYGGRADLMELIAPQGPVYQAGTLAGNPLAMAAGIAALGLLDAKAYERLERRAAELERGLQRAAQDAGVPVTIQRVGSMLTVFFREQPVRNFDDASGADHGRFAAFFHAMLKRNVHLPPSGYEAWFVSLAHDDAAIARTVEAARGALQEMRT